MASEEEKIKTESGGGEVAKDGVEVVKDMETEIDSNIKSENNETDQVMEDAQVEAQKEDKAVKEEEPKTEERKKEDVVVEEEVVTTTERERQRPSRERKAVDRYWIASPASRSGGKPISIEKGSGTPLKEIPNVAYKLSKRKPDDNLQLLHTILFGKKAKVHTLKKDIGQFSGFVWTDNEEKQRAKMKEKLDKCVKEKLLHFCDVLNIPINKASIKKEDLTVKLLEFLESPHATTEELLAEKDQKGKSQKRKATSGKSRSSKSPSAEKSDKKTQSGEKLKRAPKADEDDETDNKDDDMENQPLSSEEEDVALEKPESDEDTESEEEKDISEEKETTPKSKSSSKVNSGTEGGKKSANSKKSDPEKSSKTPAISEKKTAAKSKKPSAAEAEDKSTAKNNASSSKAKGSSSKKQKVEEETKNEKPIPAEEKPPGKKKESKPKSKEKGKKKTSKVAEEEPTNAELRAQAVNILKEVDFNTATLSDILRLLGSHFGLDLMHRKVEVKAIITDVIESMSNSDDDEEDEDDEDADDSGKE